ncbi:MAG: hypothetical protein WCG93_07185 [Paludibacter sp.]
MRFKYLKIIILSLSLLFVSCEANIDLHNISEEVALNPSLVVPLGGANLTLRDMLSLYKLSGSIITDGTDIYFQNDDSLNFVFPALNLQSKIIPFSVSLPVSIPGNIIPPNTILPTVGIPQNLDLGMNHNPSTERIDSVLIDQADFSISLNQTDLNIPAQNVNISITFPQIKMLNTGELNVINFNSIAYNVSKVITLKHFMLYAKGNSDFPAIIQLNIKTGSNPVVLTPASQFQLQINITKMPFKVAYGYFETYTNASRVEQIALNLNKNLPNCDLKYANPQIEISTKTNIGTYLGFKVNYIKAFAQLNPTDAIFAKFNGVDSTTLEFDSKPTIPGMWLTTKLKTLDKDWGGTDKLFEKENKPDILEYKFSISPNNILIKSNSTPNYITPDAAIKVYVTTKIPFQFKAGSYFEYKDSFENIFETISKELNKYPQNKINSTALVLNIKNGLPATTKLAITLTDSLGGELVTDFKKDYSVVAGSVDNEGIIQSGKETNQTLTISLTNDQLNILRKARKIKYTVRIEGEDFKSSNIHFTENNSFAIKFGFFVNGNLNTK